MPRSSAVRELSSLPSYRFTALTAFTVLVPYVKDTLILSDPCCLLSLPVGVSQSGFVIARRGNLPNGEVRKTNQRMECSFEHTQLSWYRLGMGDVVSGLLHHGESPAVVFCPVVSWPTSSTTRTSVAPCSSSITVSLSKGCVLSSQCKLAHRLHLLLVQDPPRERR
jgi:hypothetical protein